MKTSTKIMKNLFMNLPISLTMSVVAQAINIVLGRIGHFILPDIIRSFAVSYVLAFAIGMLIPCEAWGVAFARRCGAKAGTLKFGLLVNVPVNTTFCLIMTLFMTWFTACMLGGAPLAVLPGGFCEMIVPVWCACYVVSALTVRPATQLAVRLTGGKLPGCEPER